MKHLIGPAVPVVLSAALCGCLLCACQKQDTEITWQATLPNTGVGMGISGGEVTESTTILYPAKEGDSEREVRLLSVPAAATVCWENLQAENVTVDFAYAWDGCYQEYHTSEPIEKVDYSPLPSEGEMLRYRFDTSYSFMLTITTEQGQDELILDCRREL